MVKIVLHLVVLWQAQQVAVLHVEEVFGLKGRDEEDGERTGGETAVRLPSHT